MEAILLTKKMVVEAGLASSEDGGRIKKDAVVQEEEVVGVVQEMVTLDEVVMVGLVEVQNRTSEAVSNNNHSKIQTSMKSKIFSKKFFSTNILIGVY